MLRPLLVAMLALGGCSTPGGLGNALTPDEFTLGHGKADSEMDGTMSPHWDDGWPVDMEGETESTYMALTWDLPTWDSTETREDRRKIREESLILDMAAEEQEEAPVLEPPEWLPTAFGGLIVLLLIYVWFKLKRSNGWH